MNAITSDEWSTLLNELDTIKTICPNEMQTISKSIHSIRKALIQSVRTADDNNFYLYAEKYGKLNDILYDLSTMLLPQSAHQNMDQQSSNQNFDYSDDLIDCTLDTDFTGATPVYINVFNQRIQTNTWRDVLREICGILYRHNPQIFTSCVNDNIKQSNHYFSNDQTVFRKPIQINNTHIYTEGHKSAKDICKTITYIVTQCGLTRDDVHIYIKKDRKKPRTHTVKENELCFGAKYDNFTINKGLFVSVLECMRNKNNISGQFKTGDILKFLQKDIQEHSRYKQPSYVIQKVQSLLKDKSIIALVPPHSQGIYKIVNMDMLNKYSNNPDLVNASSENTETADNGPQNNNQENIVTVSDVQTVLTAKIILKNGRTINKKNPTVHIHKVHKNCDFDHSALIDAVIRVSTRRADGVTQDKSYLTKECPKCHRIYIDNLTYNHLIQDNSDISDFLHFVDLHRK